MSNSILKFFDASKFSNMKISIFEEHNVLCKINNNPLKVKIKISYTIKDKQVDLDSLRLYIKQFTQESVESLCLKIKNDLDSYFIDLNVRVEGIASSHAICIAEL